MDCPDLLRCFFEQCVLVEGREVLFRLACVSKTYEIAAHYSIVDFYSYFEEDKCKRRVQFHSLYSQNMDFSYDSGLRVGEIELEKMKYVRTLNLYKNTRFPGCSLQGLIMLTSLNLGDNSKITNDNLSALTALKSLNLYWYAFCQLFIIAFNILAIQSSPM
jgi:hypothetical protein